MLSLSAVSLRPLIFNYYSLPSMPAMCVTAVALATIRAQ